MKQHLWEPVKHILDGISVTTTIATLIQVLPAISALFSTIWICIRIWETDTVKALRGKPVNPSSVQGD